MMKTLLLLATSALLALHSTAAWRTAWDEQRVHMHDIDSLTFHHGRYTNSRRVSAVPQLEMVGGSAPRHASQHVHAVQCRKSGHGYGSGVNDIQWKCQAELPAHLSLGETVVSCEGYEHPQDTHILRGSCGLRYTLHQRQPQHGYQQHRGGGGFGRVFALGVVGFLLFLAFNGSAQGTSFSNIAKLGGWALLAYFASWLLVIPGSPASLFLVIFVVLSMGSNRHRMHQPWRSGGYGYGGHHWGGSPYFGGWGSPGCYEPSCEYGRGGGYGGSGWAWPFFGGVAAANLASHLHGGGYGHGHGGCGSWGGCTSRSSRSWSGSGSGSRRASHGTRRSTGFGGTQNR